MNRKRIMILSSVVLMGTGIFLSFSPDALLNFQSITIDDNALILSQILGALYFSFGILNWMAKNSLVGGIYNRPIVLANFSHYLIGSLTLIKGQLFTIHVPFSIWLIAVIYLFFCISFGLMLLTNPVLNSTPLYKLVNKNNK